MSDNATILAVCAFLCLLVGITGLVRPELYIGHEQQCECGEPTEAGADDPDDPPTGDG